MFHERPEDKARTGLIIINFQFPSSLVLAPLLLRTSWHYINAVIIINNNIIIINK